MQKMQRDKSLDNLFIEAVIKYPHNTAITYCNDGLHQDGGTYTDLNNAADHISSCLQNLDIQNATIAVYSKQSPLLIPCLLGILKIPSAFAPIGLEWPHQMVNEFLKSLDSNLKAVVVDKDVLEEFQQTFLHCNDSKDSFHWCENTELLSHGFMIYCRAERCSVSSSVHQSLAYVMQTSGTTGQPKIVRVPHECIVPNITSLRSIFNATCEDCVALISPYTFDPFIVQLFIALSSGAKVAVIPESVKLQPRQLCKLLLEQLKVTILQPTPSLVYLLGQNQITSQLLGPSSSLKVLAFGGEPCPSLHTLRQWKHHQCTTKLFNLYGITEVSSWASCHEISDDELHNGYAALQGDVELPTIKDVIRDNVPLGIPLDDTVIEVWNDEGHRIDEGVGHIFIGGEKRVCFLDDEKCCKPLTMRATGDLGYAHNGQVWYHGRENRQIKKMGKRITLDWIEQVISRTIPDHAYFTASETNPEKLQNSIIYLFVKPTFPCNQSQLVASIKKALEDLLPPHARPDYIYVVDTIPMTSHGKVDSRELLRGCKKEALDLNVSVHDFLVKTWSASIRNKAVIQLSSSNKLATKHNETITEFVEKSQNEASSKEHQRFGVENKDSFVESGGTSIDAVRMVSEIESWLDSKLGSPVDISELLDIVLNETFADLCRYVDMVSAAVRASWDVSVNGAKSSSKSEIGHHFNDNSRLSPDLSPKHVHFENSSVSATLKNGGTNEELYSSQKTATSLPSAKRMKKDQYNYPCGTENCFCSIQRGMRTTTCTLCTDLCHRETKQDLKTNYNTWESTEKKLEAKVFLHWKVDFHKCIDASPLLVGTEDSTVAYLGSHAHVFKAVQLSDGKVLWEARVGDRIESSAAVSRCGRFVIVGCYDGKVYVFTRKDGTLVWTFQTGGQVKSSPCVDPSTGFVWIGSHDHQLYALDVTGNECVTSIDCGSSCFSSPCILEGHDLVFICTLAGRVFAVCTLQMAIKWTRQCPKPVFASPLATPQGVLCACVDGSIYCYSLHGDALWVFQTSGPVFSSPCLFTSNIVFGSHDGCVYCINDSGQLTWKFTTDSQVYSTPFITTVEVDITSVHSEISRSDAASDSIVIEQANTTINVSPEVPVASKAFTVTKPVVFVCCTSGTLYCLSLQSGHLLTKWALPGPVFSSPVVRGTSIVIGCRDNYLYCLGITTKINDH